MSRKYQNNFENYLIVQRVAAKTKKAYLQAVHGLEAFHKQPPDRLLPATLKEPPMSALMAPLKSAIFKRFRKCYF